MTRLRTALPILGVMLSLLAACGASGEPLPIKPRLVSGNGLIVWTAHAYALPTTGVVVHGMVCATSPQGEVPGHLHIAVVVRDGRSPIMRDTRWRAMAPRGSRVGAYGARLPISDASSISQITVSYIPTGFDAESAGLSS